jgi:MFS family permease
MTAGSCAAVALVLAWAAVDNLILFYLIWAGIGVTLAAVLYEPAFVVVATWFSRKRGRALTVLTFLAGFASVIYIPLAGWLVEAQGWRSALVTLALILAAGTIPFHALLLRRRPADLGLHPDGGPATAAPDSAPGTPHSVPERNATVRAAIRGSAFWWLTAAFCLNALGALALTVHLVPYLTDKGYGFGFATTMAGMVGIMALPGRLIFTPLGDRLPRSAVTAGIFLLQALAIATLVVGSGTAAVVAFVVIFGAGFGAITPARASLIAEFYGSQHYGSIAGFLGLFLTAARAIAPVGAGAWYDLIGSYNPALWTLAALSVASAVAVVMAERRAALQPALA